MDTSGCGSRTRASTRLFSVLLLALICGVARPASAPEKKPLTAILLVAHAQVNDPSFGESVVLVMNDLGPAPVGVIVNRPTSIPVAHLFPELKSLAQLPDKVHFGGPLGLETVWFLFRARSAPEHAIRAFEGVYLSADRDTLVKLLARDKPMDGLRVFVGHAGWAPGQLEAEIARGDWTLEHANPEAVFEDKSEHPWPGPHSERGEQSGSGPST